MYGAIIGDIVGSPFEFDRGDKTKNFELFGAGAGFTDDTVMTIAVGEALLEAGKEASVDVIKELVIYHMKKWGRKYPNAGYGGRFGWWLMLENPEPYNSYGNGSAMRVSAAGWLYDSLERTREVARATAEVTHNHPEGIKGAEATASAIYMARNGSSKEEIKGYIIKEFQYDLSRSCDEIRPSYYHVESCQGTVPEILIGLVAVVMCISLCACNGRSNSNDPGATSIFEVQGESISGVEASEEQNNFMANGSSSENASENIIGEMDSNENNPQEAVTLPIDTGRCETYWISGSVVNFRETPDTDGEVIGLLTKGTEIVKIAEEGDWLYVSYGETKGYIHGDYASAYPPVNSAEGEVYIIVKKSERLLELWQGETLIGSFSIGLGWEPEGHKQVEGDGKTPEGEYYVCVRNSNSSFYLSLGVSYPNKEDAAAALEDGRIDNNTYDRIVNAIDKGQCPDWNTALGGAIMIHGCGGSSDWTAGCVAVDNDVMDLLFDYCPIGTKITILP